MNTKGTIALLIIALVVLGAIYYESKKEEQVFSAAAIPVQTIPAVTSATLERIVIDTPDADAVTLTKNGDKWYTNVAGKHEADPNAVTAVTGVLEKPIKATVVSSNEASYGEYQVTDTSGTKVQVFEKGSEKPAVDMLVGMDGPSAFSTYVRLGNSKDVLNAQSSLSMAFKRTEGWRKREIFNFSGGNVTRIAESGTSSTFAVVRGAEEKWTFEQPLTGEAESARVTSLANMLSSLQAEKFIEGTTRSLSDLGLQPARQVISALYEDKTTSPGKTTSVTLLLGNETETGTGWYAKRADSEDVFTIGIHAGDALTPDPQSMKVTPPPAPAEDKQTSGPAVAEKLQTTNVAPSTTTASAVEAQAAETSVTAVLHSDSTTAALSSSTTTAPASM